MGTSDQSAEIRALREQIVELESKLVDSDKTLLRWKSSYYWMRGRAEALNVQVDAARRALGCSMQPSDLDSLYLEQA